MTSRSLLTAITAAVLALASPAAAPAKATVMSCSSIPAGGAGRFDVYVTRGHVPCRRARGVMRRYTTLARASRCPDNFCRVRIDGWACRHLDVDVFPYVMSCRRRDTVIDAYAHLN